MKVVDPVCKMTIDSEKAAATGEHKEQTIYLCAKGCKTKFDEDPGKYFGKYGAMASPIGQCEGEEPAESPRGM
jgi:Cu+-exporting ATPase